MLIPNPLVKCWEWQVKNAVTQKRDIRRLFFIGSIDLQMYKINIYWFCPIQKPPFVIRAKSQNHEK
ncbi:hypothetical protein BW716_24695 [[Flexibacter] sp. ATCC 35208]|nr:hypothetical protein BW716_24695 [[Flexibacter] sp. ATCC 35208]